jgi:DNA-binding response OmpR family regulator
VLHHVLIIDDDPTMCTMLRMHLGKRNFQVTTHHTCEDAFAAVRSTDFDVIVTDLNMRGENGIDPTFRSS